jgi:hypothetical protein
VAATIGYSFLKSAQYGLVRFRKVVDFHEGRLEFATTGASDSLLMSLVFGIDKSLEIFQ